MALVTVNGVDIIEARVVMPSTGAWTADLAIDADHADQATGVVQIDLGGVLQLGGVAARAGTAHGLTSMRVIGGNAGLSNAVDPKDYRSVPLSTPLVDVLALVGEKLSTATDRNVLGVFLPRWTRFNQRAAEVLDALAAKAGCGWRVLYDGTVWLGTDTFPEVALPYDLLRGDPHLGVVEIGMETPSLVPGVSFLGQHVDHVEHVVANQKVRTVVTFE